jgi:hypothetical protein
VVIYIGIIIAMKREGTVLSSISEAELKKAISLQAWTGPEGSRRLRLPYFKTIGA